MHKGIKFVKIDSGVALGDYAFLAAMAYETQNASQFYLNRWFGSNAVFDEAAFVNNCRMGTNTNDNPLFYKLLSIRDMPGFGVFQSGDVSQWQTGLPMRNYGLLLYLRSLLDP